MAKKNHCVKCDHKWPSKKKDVKPKSCPRCKSYTWDKADNEKNSKE